MSNLDPFTQKLLERTQARKDAAKNKRQAPQIPSQQKQKSPVKRIAPGVPRQPMAGRFPLADKNQLYADKSRENKRHSSEGLQDTSYEKKQKTNSDSSSEELFSHHQRTENAYVVPSFAGRTPKKVNTGSSLASRLANLNQDYAEKFQLDLEEQQRTNEAELKQEQLRKEHKRIQEEERAKRVQERIFGKNHVTAQPEPSKPRNISDRVTARRPLHHNASDGPQKSNFKSANAKYLADRENKMSQQIVVDQAAMEEEEQKESVSVGDKKSIFEQKMKKEREARAKEVEVENRLKQKTPRNQPDSPMKPVPKARPGSPKKKATPVIPLIQEPIQTTPSLSEEEVEIDPLVNSFKSPAPGRGKTGMLKHARAYAAKKEQVQKKDSDSTKIVTPQKEANFGYSIGEINSPHPDDCTDDTMLTDSKAFDISEILRVAEQEKPKSPAKTPHRSSTMKDPSGIPAVLRPFIDIDLTPVQMEQTMEDEPSEFAKQLRAKKSEMQTAGPHNKLSDDDMKAIPQKPPRTSRHSVHETEFPPTYEEFIAKKMGKEKKEQIFPEDNNQEDVIVTKPIEINSRKKIRRSVSVSDVSSGTPVKSAYNDNFGSKYDAHSSFDKPDLAYSKKDQIQNILEEAAYQQNIVLQTSQALNVAESGNEDKRGSPEVIEGERLLLLATEKRTACLEEVRKIKQTDSEEYLNELDLVKPCKATLALTDMKIPLHQGFVGSLRAGRMDLGVFHFVIIVSCGSKNVYSTKVVSTYDEMEGYSLLVKSNILMSNVPHDFVLTVKVFGLHTKKNNDQPSKVRRTYTNSQSPGNLKSLFSKRRDDELSNHASPQTVFRTSNFKLVGQTKINLNILGNGSKHVLTDVPSNCPIEGFIQLRVGCKPEFTADASGFLTILEDVGGYTAWNRRWCHMRNNKVLFWRYPDDEENKESLGSIDLCFCIDDVTKTLSRDKCARPHTFEMNIKRPFDKNDAANLVMSVEGKNTFIKYWVCADNKEDRVIWMDAINKQLNDSRAWLLKHAVKKQNDKKANKINDHAKAVYV